MKCHKCGATVHECPGWLRRVNEKGIEGIWECSPSCNLPRLSDEERVTGAIESGERCNVSIGEITDEQNNLPEGD